MVNSNEVFDAVRRGYCELGVASNSEIINHFEQIEPDTVVGHTSNIKGIVFEQEVVAALNEQGMDAMMFEATNHAISDIALMNDGDIAAEIQLKATDSESYINETLAEHPDIAIITTSEVASSIDHSMVIDAGIDNAALNAVVTETLALDISTEAAPEVGSNVITDTVSEGLAEVVADAALPISPIGVIGALFGLPFL